LATIAYMSINWVDIYSEYKGKWVALAEDESQVIGYGPTAKAALEKAWQEGYRNPILTKIPKKVETYVGLF
jgi:hypothetical protein